MDVGEVRIGLARGSALARIAEPLKIVPAQEALNEISRLIQKNQAGAIVVGLPRGLAGQETAQTRAVKAWVKKAKANINLPFYWQDEAMTSQLAGQDSSPADERAAAIILQDFLNTPGEDRVLA